MPHSVDCHVSFLLALSRHIPTNHRCSSPSVTGELMSTCASSSSALAPIMKGPPQGSWSFSWTDREPLLLLSTVQLLVVEQWVINAQIHYLSMDGHHVPPPAEWGPICQLPEEDPVRRPSVSPDLHVVLSMDDWPCRHGAALCWHAPSCSLILTHSGLQARQQLLKNFLGSGKPKKHTSFNFLKKRSAVTNFWTSGFGSKIAYVS